MKKKNAFTLVELLAVIAILAILVIIALPNVIELFNKSKKQVFLTEVRKIYAEAEKKYVLSSMSDNIVKVINSEDDSRLDMSGERIKYCIIFDDNGMVKNMNVSNGKWIANLNSEMSLEDLSIDDLKEGNLDDNICSSDEIEKPDKPSNPEDTNIIHCSFDGNMVQGAEYINGDYTYRYMQQGSIYNIKFKWSNMSEDGWGVALTNQENTDAVDSKICTYINDKPLISSSCMFYQTKASSIDLNGFNTSNIKNMFGMFNSSSAKEIKGLEKFDTSNVTNMNGMFRETKVNSLNLSSFDTSKVTNMGGMFFQSPATSLDLSNFDTSNVTDMGYMFYTSKATSLDLSNFDTSKVTTMRYMFGWSKASEIKGLNNFNTSKVRDMGSMFWNSIAKKLDVSNFDTSNVTDMSSMFYDCIDPVLDLRNFNTSKVKNMHHMFYANKATSLNLTSFDTSNVTDMGGMFSSSEVRSLDLSSFDIKSSTDITDMFRGSQVKTGYAKNDSIATRLNSLSYNPSGLTFIVK